jgi:hypothetical protein
VGCVYVVFGLTIKRFKRSLATLTRYKRYSLVHGAETAQWRLETSANPKYKTLGPYYLVTRHRTNPTQEERPLPEERHSWERTKSFAKMGIRGSAENVTRVMPLKLSENEYNKLIKP